MTEASSLDSSSVCTRAYLVFQSEDARWRSTDEDITLSPSPTWENVIKIDYRQNWCGCMNWITQARGRINCRSSVNQYLKQNFVAWHWSTVVTFRVINIARTGTWTVRRDAELRHF